MRVFFQSLIALLLVHCALPAADDSKRLLDEANAHYRAFRSAEAIRTYREYLEQYPDRADIRVFLGAALLNSGAMDAALQECKRAISMDSGHAKAYSLAGRVYSGDEQLAGSSSDVPQVSSP